MRSSMLLAGALLLTQAGCSDCGDYGVAWDHGYLIADEVCGTVYGADGEFIEHPTDPALDWAMLTFEQSSDTGRLQIEHEPVTAAVLWSDLTSGEPLGTDRVWSDCITEEDDTIELVGGRGAMTLSPGDTVVRRMQWSMRCWGGALVASGEDRVELDLDSSGDLHPLLAELLEGGSDAPAR